MLQEMGQNLGENLRKVLAQGETPSAGEMSSADKKVYTPKMVRELLDVDNDRIINLCKKISLVPKKNSKGQTYFSRDDVKILKRIQDLQTQARKTQEAKQKAIQAPVVQTQPVIDPKLAKTAIDTLDRLNNTLNTLEENLSNKLIAVLDDKLDGMDEVVVELIRAKTENENLRHKINELNKENFYLKNNLNSYKPLGFGLFTKKQIDFDEF